MATTTEFVRVGDISLSYMVIGTGPWLLVPWCNHPWPAMPYFSELSRRFTVVLASPCGYQRSSRLPEDEAYDADTIARDLLAVCDAVGAQRFSVLGYSLTAAMAAWLARRTTRVDAVLAGGFPLLGSYDAVRRGAEHGAAGLAENELRAGPSPAETFDARAPHRPSRLRPRGPPPPSA